MRKIKEKIIYSALVLLLSAALIFCNGCGLMLAPIMGATLTGAGIGAIIGHQSEECLAGALVGGAILGGLETAKQTDKMAKKQRCEQKKSKITVHTENEDGSFTPVKFKKTDKDVYAGPDGKFYIHEKDGSFVPVEISKKSEDTQNK